ncbi:MAG: YigZ family protein [Oscillospiraceae bacterium]
MERIFYKTIKEEAVFEFEVKKSRFIGYFAPCQSREQAEAYIQKIKNLHKQATHNVPAFILREQETKWCSDDHEPQGTAGMPVLKAIEGEGYTNVVAVVTRYFGGTLLGTGGLVRAYSDAISGAMAAAENKTMVLSDKIEITTNYTDLGKLQYILPKYTNICLDTIYEDNVKMILLVAKDETDKFEKEVTEIFAGRIVPKIVDEGFFEF